MIDYLDIDREPLPVRQVGRRGYLLERLVAKLYQFDRENRTQRATALLVLTTSRGQFVHASDVRPIGSRSQHISEHLSNVISTSSFD